MAQANSNTSPSVEANSNTSSSVEAKDSKVSEDVKKIIEDDQTYKTGDTEIISSDNVRFRVPSYYLMYSSAAFRDMASLQLSDDGKRTLEFTDAELENNHVLRLYLRLVSTGKLGYLESNLPYVKELAAFLDKWDCGPVLGILLVNIESRVQARVPRPGLRANPMEAFIAGAWAGSKDFCRVVLQCHPQAQWGPALEPTLPDTTSSDDCVWDPTSWPLWVWKDQRIELHLYALARAYCNGESTGEQFVARYVEYLRIMNVSRGKPQPKPDSVSDDATQRFGDYIITSSDCVRFKVDSHKMFWASRSFPLSKEVHLTEPFETAAVVRLFWTILCRGTLGECGDTALVQVENLVLFCQKWRCDPVLNIIRTGLTLNVLQHPHAAPIRYFSIAALQNDINLCELVLTNSTKSPSPYSNRWAPSTWPDFMMLGRVPKYILFALAHSCVKSSGVNTGKPNVARFAKLCADSKNL